jgi:hypothetical protein
MWPHSTSKIGLARVCHSEVLPVHPGRNSRASDAKHLEVFQRGSRPDECASRASQGRDSCAHGRKRSRQSKLMKIASGLIPSYEAEVFVEGERVHLASPRDASRHGISIIHQELSLVPDCTWMKISFWARNAFVQCFSSIESPRSSPPEKCWRSSIILDRLKLPFPSCESVNNN